MPLTPAGIEYVSKNFSEFLKNIGAASSAISKMNGISQDTADSLNALGDSLSGMGKAAGAIGAAGNIIGKIGGIFKGVGGAVGMGASIGGLIGSVVPGIGNATGAVVGSIIGAVTRINTNLVKLFWSIMATIATFLPKTLAKIVGAGISIGKALYEFGSKLVSIAKSILSPIINGVKSLFSAIFGMFSGGGGGGGGWRSLGGSIFTAMFKFEALKQIIRGLINEIKALASVSFNAAVELQVLTVRLDNLIAMQVRNAGLTTSYGKSIQIATGYTQELLVWIQKLALATPVSVDDISNMVYLGLAMGWSVSGAKTLTKAIVDYTAAIGMGSEISERIIYNFAQMKQQGKVTGTELRDLGRGAFMPINEILKQMYYNIYNVDGSLESATIGFQEFKDMASAGTVPVEEFFKAFEDFVAINMPDMAYKMNYTFKAVMQNVQDLFKILLGWNVLGPMIASITKPIQDFINSLKSSLVLKQANAIGNAIANMVTSIRQGFSYISMAVQNVVASLHLPAMSIQNIVMSIMKFGFTLREIGVQIMNVVNKYILPITSKIGDKFSSDFSVMSKDFFDWGANLIFSFAQGMVKAAASVLTQVMNFIAGILTGWLSPGSPPKILPDIDKWGMETINEWLHGFTQGDFDILKDIQGVIKDSLGALVNLGVITDVQASEEYLGISLDLIEAMDELNRTSTISASIFERLAAIGGEFGQEISELLQLQLQYADATRIAEQAQIDFDNAIKATQVATGKSNRLIREYNKLLRSGANKGALKDKLNLVNLAKIELDVARKAEEDKKTALDIAKENLKALQDSIELQKSLIKTMTDLAQAQKDAMDAASGGAGAVEDLTEAIEDLSDAFGGFGAGGKKIIDFDALKQAAETAWIAMMDGMKKKWAEMWKANVSDPNSPFQTALNTLESAWDTFAKSINLPSWDEISAAWGTGTNLIGSFQAVLALFATDIKTNEGILATLGTIAGNLIDNLVTKINTPENQKKLKDGFVNLMNGITNLILGKEDKVGKGVPTGPTPWATRIGRALIEGIKTEAGKAVDSIDWSSIMMWIGKKLLSAVLSIQSWRNIGIKIVQLLGGGMAEHIATTDWKGMWNSVVDGVDDLKKRIGDRLDLIKSNWNTKWDEIKTKVMNIWNDIKTHIKTTSDTIKKYIDDLLWGEDGILTKFKSIYASAVAAGKNIVQGIIDGINLLIGNLSTVISDLVSRLPTWLQDFLTKGTLPSVPNNEQPKQTPKGGSGSIPTGNIPTFGTGMLATIQAPISAPPVYGGNTVNFNGDIQISNGMDWAVFKAQVQRAIVET